MLCWNSVVIVCNFQESLKSNLTTAKESKKLLSAVLWNTALRIVTPEPSIRFRLISKNHIIDGKQFLLESEWERMWMCKPEQRVVHALVRAKRAFPEAQHSGDKVYSFVLAPAQLAAHGYSARTLAFTLALRFLKRDFLSLMCHIRCGTFTWVALQVWKHSENLISNFFSLCKNRWYRARVMGSRPDDEYDVFYVDFGDREWVTRDRIVPAWSGILQLPLQAIECSLVNVQPIGEDQSSMNCTPSNSLIR